MHRWRVAAIAFCLVVNAAIVAAALLTEIPQWVVFVLFLASFIPYIISIKFSG